MFGWSISASACRSASKRAMTCSRVHAELDDLERHAAAHRLLLLGHVNDAAAAFADFFQQLVAANFAILSDPDAFEEGFEGSGVVIGLLMLREKIPPLRRFNRE